MLRLLPAAAGGAGGYHQGGGARPSPRSLLNLRLVQPRVGNVAGVKLISLENRMVEWGDEHLQPNIDCQFAAFMGCVLELSPGVHLR